MGSVRPLGEVCPGGDGICLNREEREMKQFSITTILAPVTVVAFLSAPNIAFGDGLQFGAVLSGAQEVPEVFTITTGEIKAEFDDALIEVEVRLRVRDGVAVDRAHFHCARPGVNGSIAFGIVDPGPADCNPAELAAGDLECTLTNDDFAGADCDPEVGRPVNNIAALAFAMRDGLIYANVHTLANPAGEIRGQLLEADDDD